MKKNLLPKNLELILLQKNKLKFSIKKIDAFFFDFDGVLTNNTVILNENGTESVICNRSGSKSIKDKNIFKINNKPLLYYSIAASKSSKLIDRTFVLTDSKRYSNIASKYGAEVPYLRSKRVSGDRTSDARTIIDFLNKLKLSKIKLPDLIVHLRPTSPIRNSKIIDSSIKKFIELKFPLVNPDFIYLDGPDQFNINNSKKINFNIDHLDLMPMSSDILKIEFFLVPGTIVVSDGRSANVEFLLKNFKRDWIHYYDRDFDQHILYLNSQSLGKLNDMQLNFYK